MTQLSLLFETDEPPDCYLIDDPVEKLEMHYPRETLLFLLEQRYGPEVKLERTKDSRANGVLYKCPCPVHHNDGDTRGIVYLDQRLRIYCQSCKATKTLPQLLENCEIDPADVLKSVLENLEELQQRFETLDLKVEEELQRSWQGDTSPGLRQVPALTQTAHGNPPLPPSTTPFDFKRSNLPERLLPETWNAPSELEQALLELQQAISTSLIWESPFPVLQDRSTTIEPDQTAIDLADDLQNTKAKPKSKTRPQKSANRLIGTDDAQSDLTLVITSTVAERDHLLSCEKFQPVVVAPAKGSILECRDQLAMLPALNYLLALQEYFI